MLITLVSGQNLPQIHTDFHGQKRKRPFFYRDEGDERDNGKNE